MAEDASSRQPPRDAKLSELEQLSKQLLRGQEVLRNEVRQAEVRRARESPRLKGGERPVERPAPSEPAPEQQAVVRTRQDVETELKATQQKFEQYKNELYSQGKIPSRRSSTVRGFESQISGLRQERAGFAAVETPTADLQKRLELFRQGKALTGQQTAAEVEQLGVIKKQVGAVRELRAAQKGPVLGPAAPTAAERRGLDRSAQINVESRLANLDTLRRQGEASRAAAPQGLILPTPTRGSSVGAAVLQDEEKRIAAERQVAAIRQQNIARASAEEVELDTKRLEAEREIGIQRDASKPSAPVYGVQGRAVAPDPRGRAVLPYYGQVAGAPGTPSLGAKGGAPGRLASGPVGAGVVQEYQRSPGGAYNSILAAGRTEKAIPAFYQQLQAGAVIQAQASQQMRRHGALTTEFLSALARGETTLAEFRFQIGSTIAKFGGWTIAAAAVYGVIGAISTLSRGAKESLSGVQQLNRFITNVDTKAAAKGFRDVSREVNVSIGDVANAQANFLRIYHDQGQALEASRTALKLTKLDNVSTADSLRYLTSAATEFQLPASKIVVLGDKLANVFRTMGTPIQDSLPAFARSAAAVKNAGGDLTQLIELIAIARRRTGQTGNVIGNALARSASNFVNRPSSVSVFKQFGLDPRQATTDYTQFVINAIRKAKDLSGPEIRDLAAALGGPQLGSRIFVGLLRGYKLLPQAAKSAGAESAGQLDKELKIKLAQVDEQISKVGHSLERLGSGLASAGAFLPLGIALKTLNAILSVANNVTDTFAGLPGPLKDVVLYLGEAYLALKLIRRTGLASGLAAQPGLGFLGYSPKEQLRRNAIITQRNISAGFGNQAEQLANQSQIAGQNAFVFGQAALSKREESLSLQARNASQKLIAAADREAVVLADQSLAYSQEALAAKQQYEVVLAAQNEADANLVGLQKRRMTVTELAQRQGGLIVGGAGGKPDAYTADETRNIEAGAIGAASVRETSGDRITAANDRLAAAAAGGTTSAEKVAAAAAAAGIAVEAEGAAVAGSAAGMTKLQRSYAILGAGLTTARGSAAALLAGIRGLLFNPLTLALVGFEVIPALISTTRKNIKAQNDRLTALAADTNTQGSLQQRQQFLDAHKPHTSLFGQVLHDINPFTLDTGQQAQREQNEYNKARGDLAFRQRAQADAIARGAPAPFLTIGQASRRLKGAITAYQQGAISVAQLDAAYVKAQYEIKQSAEAVAGGAKGAQKVAAGLHAARVAILQVVDGTKSIAEALQGASLADIASALKGQADQIAVFGLQRNTLPRVRQEYARASQLVAQDPSAKNLQNYAVAKQALDSALSEAQTQLQQSLTLATTGAERNAAYTQFFGQIDSGVTQLRQRLSQDRAATAAQSQKLRAAQKKRDEDQKRYNAAQLQTPLRDSGQTFEQGLGVPDVGVPLGAGLGIDQRKKDLDSQQKALDILDRGVKASRKAVGRLRDLYKRDKKAYDALRAQFSQQEAQSQDQVAELQGQLAAGRTGDPVLAIIIQLRVAQAALANDVRHHVTQEQRLQDELKIQQLQDQKLQAEVQRAANKAALATSRIDPTNVGAVDRSNLAGLYQQLAVARTGRPSPARTDQINQLKTQINQTRFQQAQDLRQQAQAENDAYYAILEAGQSTLHPVRVAQLEYQKALSDLKYAHGKADTRQALANIKTAQEGLAEAVHQNAIDETNAYYGLLESRTTDPLKLAQLEYQNAQQLQKQARGRKEQQQTQIDKNNALKNLYQTRADERLKTIEFETSIGKLTNDQEISALKKLLKLTHLTKDFRRQILSEIYQLQNSDQSQLELNVGNIRLPTLYDVRRLALAGSAAATAAHVTQTNHYTVHAQGADANDIALALESHSRGGLVAALKAGG